MATTIGDGLPGQGLVYHSARGRWVLVATVLGSGIAAIDATVVGIALPSVGRDFRVGLGSLQWVVTAYTLTVAGLLLLAGALGDRYGRRRVFLLGVTWFAGASLLCALAPNAPTLIAARALQGVGGALLTPGSLSLLEASFRPADRARAIGAWSGLGGLATALGPFVGGWLISAVSWRLIFFINLPLAVAVVVISRRYVPESRDEAASGRIDGTGAALATLGLGALCAGLIDGPSAGWTAATVVGGLVGGVGLLVGFVVRQRLATNPLLSLGLFRSRQFTATNLVTFAVYGALGGTLFLLPVELQQVAGYSPLRAGASLLPVTACMLVLSARSGALASRIGPRLQMSVGPLVVAAGLALFSRITASGGYLPEVLPAVLVFGLGLSVTVAPLTATALASAPVQRAGMASAVNNDVARTAGLIAVAVLPAASGLSGSAYLHPAVFAPGFRTACLIGAVVCAVGGAIAAVTIRNPARRLDGPGVGYHCGLDAPPLREPAGEVSTSVSP